MPTTPELDAALVAAARALPAHFSNADDLTVEPLDAIQATTMSLPGGAFAVESVVQGNDSIGSVVLIITGLVDHKNGEVFDRTEARTLWTAALEETFASLQGDLGEFKTGQAHMTDPFDVLAHAAWNVPQRTRAERARLVREDHANDLEALVPTAREIISALLDRYEEYGVEEMTHVYAFQVPPLSEVGDWGLRESAWEDLELVQHWRAFLDTPDRYLRHLD